MRSPLHLSLIGLGALVIVAVGLVVALSTTIARRIAAMLTTVEAIVEEDMRRRVPTGGSQSAFDRQEQAFSQMLDRMGELMATLGAVSNDIAHDLRTPIAKLHGTLTTIAARPEAQQLGTEIAVAIEQNEDIQALFAAILRIAEVEGGERHAQFATIDLVDLALPTIRAVEPMVVDGARTIALEATQAVSIVGDWRLLVQMLVNLIENAVHHRPEGTHIRISIVTEPRSATLSVSDEGPGIAPGDRHRALQRFGRL